MPDHPKPNVFAPEFLDRVGQRETQPVTTAEATWAGPWRVEPLGKEFAVVRESGGEPEAVTELRDTALLLAAIFPVVGRKSLYCLEREGVTDPERTEDADQADAGEEDDPILARLEEEDADQPAIALKSVMGERGFATVGRLRALHQGIVESLSIAEYFLRSPTAFAFLLEAAPVETLEQADAILAQRMLNPQKAES